jgi:hypothetical protein
MSTPIQEDIKARASMLFDAYLMSGSISLGAGHAQFGLKFATRQYAAEEVGEDYLAKQVDQWIKPAKRNIVYNKLKQIALSARKEAGQSP